LLALAFSGAAAPQALLDPGAVVRWGLPVLTVLSELAAAVAVGGAAVAAFVLPRAGGASGDHQHRDDDPAGAWASTMVVVSVAAGVWALLRVAHLVLSYAGVSGTSPA